MPGSIFLILAINSISQCSGDRPESVVEAESLIPCHRPFHYSLGFLQAISAPESTLISCFFMGEGFKSVYIFITVLMITDLCAY